METFNKYGFLDDLKNDLLNDMKNRKTVEIDFIKEKINLALSNKEFPLNTDQKEILCATIETILHKVNGYKGFMFLDNSDTEILTNGYFSRKYF